MKSRRLADEIYLVDNKHRKFSLKEANNIKLNPNLPYSPAQSTMQLVGIFNYFRSSLKQKSIYDCSRCNCLGYVCLSTRAHLE